MKNKTRRIILSVASLVFTIIISLGLFAGIRARKIIAQDQEQYTNLYAKEQTEKINELMGNIEISVNHLSSIVSDGLDKNTLTDDAKRISYTDTMYRIIKQVSEETDGAVASYLRYNPSFTPATSGIFMEKNQYGYFERLTPTDFSIYDPTDVEHVGWYYIPVQNHATVWMSPYQNKNINIYMISYVIPLFDVSGSALGVLGMDIDFSYITNQVKEVKIYDDGYMCIVDSMNRVQSHPTLDIGTTFTSSKNEMVFEHELLNGMKTYLVVPQYQVYRSANQLFTGVLVAIIFSLLLFCSLTPYLLSIVKKRENQREKITSELQSVGGIYESMHNVSFKSNRIREYYAAEYIKYFFKKDYSNIYDSLSFVLKQITLSDYYEPMREFLNPETLAIRMNGKKSITYEFKGKQNGWCRARWIRIDHMDVLDEVVFAIEQINEEKERENRLLYLSETDLMTDLKNRGSGEVSIRNLIAKGKSGCFILLDIDNFKKFNDFYGHHVGDKVIIEAAKVLKMVFSTEDVVMRLGGDEFAIYMIGVEDIEYVQKKIQVLFSAIDNIRIEDMLDTKIHISLGATFYSQAQFSSFDVLYREADAAMYKSKKQDGNAYTFHVSNKKS